jgi:hypothetical protein
MPSFAPEGDGFFNQPGARVMLGEKFGLTVRQIGGLGFEYFGDLRVQQLTSVAQ